MLKPQDFLGPLSAGRVLDVATGSGGFIHFLLEWLMDYTEIIGVDNNERAAAAFEDSFKGRENIHFRMMDAAHLDFDPSSFDLVCISNSLHHFDNPAEVLQEMERVLRPGGHLLVSEMYCDGQTETQMTHVHLHHWWAAVDTFNGITHHQTYRRGELVELVSRFRMQDTMLYDLSDTSETPKKTEILDELNPVFDRYIQRAKGYPSLQARGEELRQRVADIGFHSASTLVFFGRKLNQEERMDQNGFLNFLLERKYPPYQIDEFIAITTQFSDALEFAGDVTFSEFFKTFSAQMIADQKNTYDNYYALVLYGRYLKKNALVQASLELIDGGEALDNLFRKTGELLGEQRRNELFDGLELIPLGTPNSEKPTAMHAMINRLETAEPDACKRILSSGLRDLPDEYYQSVRKMFAECKDVDEYLLRKKHFLLTELENIMSEGRLYFNQEITPEVLEYVRNNLEIGQGVRVGNIVYESKIPHMTKEYLAETDEDKRRYYFCHCPWVKESLKRGRSNLSPTFCNCSAAFHKKPWEVIYGQPIQAEVLESVLQGDLRCRIAIHLPEIE